MELTAFPCIIFSLGGLHFQMDSKDKPIPGDEPEGMTARKFEQFSAGPTSCN